MERTPTTLYLWISRASGFAGIVCLILFVVSKAADVGIIASHTILVLLAIAAFLFAIWSVLYELRDKGIKTR